MGAEVAVIGTGLALGAAFNYMSESEKSGAAKSAAKTSRADLLANTEQARKDYGWQGEQGAGYINKSTDTALTALSGGRYAARDAYETYANRSRSDLQSGYGSARKSLEPLSALSHYGEDAVTGKGFQESAGYGFRLGQGQTALDRMQAASGGRLSGAAMKKAMEYNQGFASNEYGNWANRAMQLGQVGYGAQGRMSDLYAQEGQGLSNIESNRANWVGNLESKYGGDVSNLETSRGLNLANIGQWVTSGAVNAASGNAGQLAQLNFAPVQYAGAGYAAGGQLAGDIAKIGAYGYGRGGGW
jgi:hypothetical protein